MYCRYLDSVTNKDSTLPPIPHLHSLLTDNGEPHPEVDIFKLVRSSYEVFDLDDTVVLSLFGLIVFLETKLKSAFNGALYTAVCRLL